MQSVADRQRARYSQQYGAPPAVNNAVVPSPPEAQQQPSPVEVLSPETHPTQSNHTSDGSLRKVHILPYLREVTARSRAALRLMRQHIGTNLSRGSRIHSSGHSDSAEGEDWVVVATEPESGVLTEDTDMYMDGPVVMRVARVEFVIPVASPINPSSSSSSTNPQALAAPLSHPTEDAEVENQSIELLVPYLHERTRAGLALFTVGEVTRIGSTSFVLAAAQQSAEPTASNSTLVVAGSLIAIDPDTSIYVSIDRSEEFRRVHVVPFQDTLPRAYDFDLFRDYIRPYFRSHGMTRYSADQQFTFHGVQFRIVATEPSDRRPRRVSRDTVIYCEGVLHPSMRNVLPPELLEQLAMLPPGLQLLLLNTDALAGMDLYERMAGLQEQLTARRGLSDETINTIPEVTWEFRTDVHRNSNQEQCMICLSDFVEGDQVRRLPCEHIYHTPCIDEWLRRCTDCPLCKVNVDRTLRGY